jgi:hypothetical protein
MAVSRLERYIAAMRVHRAYDPVLVGHAHGWGLTRERAAALIALWRAMADPPTAVLCANDEIALALMSAAREAGWSVPGDLSIVGVDDSPRSSQSDPPLSSVRLPGEEVGREAMRSLLQSLSADSDRDGDHHDTDNPAGPMASGKAVATAALEAAAVATAAEDAGTVLCPIGIPVTRLIVRATTGPAPALRAHR